MGRAAPAAALTACACFCACGAADADAVPTTVVGYNQQQSFTTSYFQNLAPEVGRGTGTISFQFSDAFLAFDLSGLVRPIAGIVLAGDFSRFQHEPPTLGIVYPEYTDLTVDARAIAPAAATDPTSLFAAYAAGTTAAAFTVDNGLTPPPRPDPSVPPGAPLGGSFSVALSPSAVATAEADRLARRTFWIGLGGSGFDSGPGGDDVVALLVPVSADFQLPEPGSAALLGAGLAIGAAVTGRRPGVGRSGGRPGPAPAHGEAPLGAAGGA